MYRIKVSDLTKTEGFFLCAGILNDAQKDHVHTGFKTHELIRALVMSPN